MSGSSQKYGNTGYSYTICTLLVHPIWAQGTFAVLKREHKLNKMTEKRPSESDRGMPLISNSIETKKTGKSGVNNCIYQSFLIHRSRKSDTDIFEGITSCPAF